ncbi:MAG TPA: GerMN domain-containing protein, partial [Chroococcales cyanobacterium]
MRSKNYVTPGEISRSSRKRGWRHLALLSAAVLLAPFLTTSCSQQAWQRTILDEGKTVTGKLKDSESDEKVHLPLKIWLVQPHDGNLDLVAVVRPAGNRDDLKDAVNELLRGPTEEEASRGISSEIPKGTVLLDVERSDDSIVLNLSRRFAIDAGGTSIETRMDQLRQTVADLSEGKKVYLNIEG